MASNEFHTTTAHYTEQKDIKLKGANTNAWFSKDSFDNYIKHFNFFSMK